MALLVSRAVAEVLGTPNKTTHITRFAAEVGTTQGAGGTALVARHVGEVLGESPPPGTSFTRFAAEVGTTQGAGGTAVVSRHVGEVLGENEKRTHITRFAATVATQAPAGTGFVQVSRQVAEVMGAGVPPYDAPPAPGRIDLFDQNWLSGISIRTVFKTDVGSSPETGDESRVGLADRPVRHVTVQWTVHTEAEHSRLLDLLKDLTDEETSIPLMVDLSTLTQNQPAGTTVLQLSTRQRRFFLGAYAFVLYRNYRCNIVNWQLVQIVNKTDTSVTISPGLSADGKAGLTCLAPALIVEPISESTITLPGKEVWQVETEFEEVASWALPVSNDAIPDGLFSFEGLPILSEEPNNAEPIEVTISRPGERMDFGRGVYVEGLEP